MSEVLSKVLRTAQVRFPWAADAKYALQRTVRRLFRLPFEAEFRALPLLALGPQPLVLDVGANRGQSIDAFHLLVPGARIVAFEPNPVLAERLRQRYGRDERVIVHPIGLADRAGPTVLNVPSYCGYPFDGLASFDEEAARRWLESRVYGYDPRRLRIDVCPCEQRTLDEFGLDPAFVKIDVQGLERRTLLGGWRTLERSRPVLMIEGPDESIVSLLGELGYQPYGYRRGKLVPDATGGLNTLFLAAKGADALGP